jgi:hypothetical protein
LQKLRLHNIWEIDIGWFCFTSQSLGL